MPSTLGSIELEVARLSLGIPPTVGPNYAPLGGFGSIRIAYESAFDWLFMLAKPHSQAPST